MGRLFRCFFALALACGAEDYVVFHFQEQQTKARDLFLTVERAARLPAAGQDREIPHLYRDVWPVVQFPPSVPALSLPDFAIDDRSETPEQLADAYERRPGGWTIVVLAARHRCRKLLATHARQVEGLAREDLESKDPALAARGLRFASEFRLGGLYDAVVPQLDGASPEIAASALLQMDDPRAIPPLIQHGGVKHFEQLRGLQRGRPADAGLLALLEAKEPGVRWRAAYALAESGDPRLVPVVERLARDEAATVREQGANIAFGLAPAAFVRVRPALVALLADKALNVKSAVAIGFAQRKDPVCVNALYELLEDEGTLAPWQQNMVVEAVDTVTGDSFGFVRGTILTEPARRTALARFEQWITSHGTGLAPSEP